MRKRHGLDQHGQRLIGLASSDQNGGADTQELGHAPLLIFCASSLERGSDRVFGVVEAPALGEGVGDDTEIVRQSRRVAGGVKFRDRLLEVTYDAGGCVV